MIKESQRKKIRWVEHALWLLGVWGVLAIVLTGIAVWSGLTNPLLRRILMHRVETLTGSRVEIRTVSVGWFSLNATVNGLVIHGKEPEGTEPLFSVEQARIGLRIDSFWGRRVGLNDLILQSPRVHILVEKNGKNNLPDLPKSASNKPLQEELLDLRVQHVEIKDGWLLYNDIGSLLAAEGGDLHFALDRGGTLEHPLYLGSVDWKSIQFAKKSDYPLPANLSAKFTLTQNHFRVEQAILDVGRSHMDLQLETKNLSSPDWTYRYRAWVDLLDIREAFRTPEVPQGRVDVRGDGTISGGTILGTGSFAGDNITLGFSEFHSANLSSRSSYILEPKRLVLPDFAAFALGGSVKGRITMQYDKLLFRGETQVTGVRLAGLTPAIDHAGFPIDKLHWDAVISAATVETWRANFRDFEVSAKMQWEEPDELAPGHVPVNAEMNIRYRYEPNILQVDQATIESPASRVDIDGSLDPKNTALDMRFETSSLLDWDDFIHAIAGDKPGTPEAATVIDGSFQWAGKITGPSNGPEMDGHFHGERVKYGAFAVDSLDGDMTYSPKELVILHGRAAQGPMQAGIEGSMQLTGWEFKPENEWSSEITLEQVPLQGLEALGGWKYPIQGLLTGQFHGRGTRAQPIVSGLIDIADGNAYSVPFNRLRGQFSLTGDEVRLANAELRFFAPGSEKTGGAGIVTGNVAYQIANKELTTDLVGASLPLANFQRVKAKNLPIGGQLTFRLKSSGPVLRPVADGSFRVVDFEVGSEVIGSFGGDLHADGQKAELKLGSAMSEGALTGGITVGLQSPYPIDGAISAKNLNLDPYLLSAVHLQKSNGHGTADGDVTLKGDLEKPETLVMDANFNRLVLTYGSVQLENSGPIHLTSTRDSLKIISAGLKGTDTNAEFSGSIQFTGRRAISMKMNGSVDLRLISGYVPDVDMSGRADLNGSVEGTLDKLRINGSVKLKSAMARSPDFPTGLTNLQGDLIFDANRLYFNNVTGEAGGGTLILTGSVNYADSPLRYDISARTDRMRIRYPEGMSWLLGGQLRLSGTTNGGLLSGKVQIQRVALNGGLESIGALTSSSNSGGTSSSGFLRNLQFDVEATSVPDSQMEWPGAHLEAEASLRVRGTADHPIMLGHIHVLSGDLYFRDNRYHVTRGDLNFANPFRLDPVINVEATTTIQQYEITLNFTGQASKLSLSYRSDPPLPGNDIITLLAVGQTSSEAAGRTGATGGGGQNAGASALLSEAISSQLGGRVERLFGITRFRVDPGLAGVGTGGSSQNAAARVMVEQQVARDLTVTYISNVSSTQQQVIQVEYNLSRTISIVGLRDQNGTFGMDIRFKKRFN